MLTTEAVAPQECLRWNGNGTFGEGSHPEGSIIVGAAAGKPVSQERGEGGRRRGGARAACSRWLLHTSGATFSCWTPVSALVCLSSLVCNCELSVLSI